MTASRSRRAPRRSRCTTPARSRTGRIRSSTCCRACSAAPSCSTSPATRRRRARAGLGRRWRTSPRRRAPTPGRPRGARAEPRGLHRCRRRVGPGDDAGHARPHRPRGARHRRRRARFDESYRLASAAGRDARDRDRAASPRLAEALRRRPATAPRRTSPSRSTRRWRCGTTRESRTGSKASRRPRCAGRRRADRAAAWGPRRACGAAPASLNPAGLTLYGPLVDALREPAATRRRWMPRSPRARELPVAEVVARVTR